MAARRKELGNNPNATRELDDQEIDKLFTSGYFGTHKPSALQRAMWWFVSLHSGFRARNGARKLCWGDISLQKNFEGKEYLTWICERGSKTRNGRENETKRAFYPLIFENSTDRCSIKFYKIFMMHRPKESCNSESPFFLAVRQKL